MWRWFPFPDPRFEIHVSDAQLAVAMMTASAIFEIGPSGAPLSAAHVSRVDQIPSDPIAMGTLETYAEGPSTDLDHVIFHVPNFLLYGQTSFDWGDWHVALSALPETEQLERELQTEGGYALTHVGRLSRVDGGGFDLDDAESPLDALGFFLSFARGFWTQPCLLVGFDSEGTRRCVSAPPLRLDARAATETWYNEYRSGDLADAARAFWTRWDDEDSNETLRLVVSWYLEANGGAKALQGRLILSQVALEMLAYEVLTDAQGNEPKGSAGVLTGDLLDHFSIPRAVPVGLPDLQALASSAVLKDQPADADFDGMGVGAAIRNALTHSKRSKRQKRQALLGEHYLQSWWFSTWALELAVLAWTGYEGAYAPRFRGQNRGYAEQVPWAPTAS